MVAQPFANHGVLARARCPGGRHHQACHDQRIPQCRAPRQPIARLGRTVDHVQAPLQPAVGKWRALTRLLGCTWPVGGARDGVPQGRLPAMRARHSRVACCASLTPRPRVPGRYPDVARPHPGHAASAAGGFGTPPARHGHRPARFPSTRTPVTNTPSGSRISLGSRPVVGSCIHTVTCAESEVHVIVVRRRLVLDRQPYRINTAPLQLAQGAPACPQASPPPRVRNRLHSPSPVT